MPDRETWRSRVWGTFRPPDVPEPLRSGRWGRAIDDVTAAWTMDRGGLQTIMPEDL